MALAVRSLAGHNRGMPTYVAFLRAINLGARRKFPKDAIRAAVESTGATDVETHINTGNVLLTTRLRSRERVEQVLEQAFLADRGFEVPTIAFTPAEVRRIAEDGAELAAGRSLDRHYVWLLKDEPTADVLAALEERNTDDVQAVVRGRACHVLFSEGYTPGQVDPTKVERLLGVGTNRNHRVISAIAGKWCA